MTQNINRETEDVIEVEKITEVVAPKSRYDQSIVEGPLGKAVWKIAFPTILTNLIAGLQGIVDHILVGNLVGHIDNAAIRVSLQIFLCFGFEFPVNTGMNSRIFSLNNRFNLIL